VAAPLIPLVGEEIWQGLTGGRSVHLTDWPDKELFPEDDHLVTAMDRVREIASSTLALRKATGKRVRLPLAELTVVATAVDGLDEFADILRDELNVKKLTLRLFDDATVADYGIVRRLTVNARTVGPRIGKDVQAVIRAARAGDWRAEGNGVVVGGISLHPGEFNLELQAADDAQAIAFLPGGGFVLLDTNTTPELEAEGLARDLVRAVQDARKAADLDVSDRIDLRLWFGSEAEWAGVVAYENMIGEETLATAVSTKWGGRDELQSLVAMDGEAGAFRVTVPAARYSNNEAIVIELSVQGKGVDV
jgi:isoleucyl-tRNA synthetase